MGQRGRHGTNCRFLWDFMAGKFEFNGRDACSAVRGLITGLPLHIRVLVQTRFGMSKSHLLLLRPEGMYINQLLFDLFAVRIELVDGLG